MPEFTPEIAPDIVSACQESGEEAASSFSRSLDGDFSLEVQESSTLASDSLPKSWNGPGLVITFQIGESGALLLLPEASGLLPDWYTKPDETGQSKLATLAQELGFCIIPEDFMPDDGSAASVKNLADAFRRSEPGGDVGSLPLSLASGENRGEATLVWPLPCVTKSLEEAEEPASEEESATEEVEPSVEETPSIEEVVEPVLEAEQEFNESSSEKPRIEYEDIEDGIGQLPTYAKSLLKVRVPVSVTLASAKYPVSQILELGPGSIIQFEKSCEDNLTLEASDQVIAEGEAVKVGDKFGIWLTSMTMPEERFWVIHGRRSGARVK